MQFDAVRNEAGINRFIMTPTKWIEQTNAIGIVSKSGRYGGGAYAHSDIAVFAITQFCEHFEIPYMTVSDWEHGNRRVSPYFFRLLEYYVRTEQMKKEGTDGKEAD